MPQTSRFRWGQDGLGRIFFRAHRRASLDRRRLYLPLVGKKRRTANRRATPMSKQHATLDGKDAEAKRLVKAEAHLIERNDVVYEIVRYGQGDTDLRYNPVRVLDVERAAVRGVRLTSSNGEKTVKIAIRNLAMEPRAPDTAVRKLVAVPSLHPSFERFAAPAQQPAKPALQSADDDQYRAWLDMGRTLVTDLSIEEQTLSEQRAQLMVHIDNIDTTHRHVIQKLEAELAKAKQEHANDRALAEARRDTLDAKLGHLADRKAALSRMLGEGGV